VPRDVVACSGELGGNRGKVRKASSVMEELMQHLRSHQGERTKGDGRQECLGRLSAGVSCVPYVGNGGSKLPLVSIVLGAGCLVFQGDGARYTCPNDAELFEKGYQDL